MTSIRVLVLLLGTATILESIHASGSMDLAWQKWKHQHAKQYVDSSEEGRRRAIWQQQVDAVSEHNIRYEVGLESYKKGLNQFSDMTWNELKQFYLSSLDVSKVGKNDKQATMGPVDVDALPESVDWRDQGYVTSVKNEGQCCSCWAFSAVGTLEGQMANKTKQNATDLSPQQIVDCDDDDLGCSGGWPASALKYTQKNGIQSLESYPYTAEDGDCNYNESEVVFKNSDLLFVEQAGEPMLQEMVASRGPISVAIDVTKHFFHYKSGVFKTDECDPGEVTHGVLAVGYGVEDGKAYWLIKNSWGPGWGDEGYIKMARNNKNMCNIASFPAVAII